jgi:hypothetical protein
MKTITTLLVAMLLAVQGMPKPKHLLITAAVTSDSTIDVTATWQRPPGTPSVFVWSYPWRTDASYTLDSLTTQSWSLADTTAEQTAAFEAPRFWEDVVAQFCVRGQARGRVGSERCGNYTLPARPIPPPDSLVIQLSHAQTVEQYGDWYVTLRWDSVPGAAFFDRVYVKAEPRLLLLS